MLTLQLSHHGYARNLRHRPTSDPNVCLAEQPIKITGDPALRRDKPSGVTAAPRCALKGARSSATRPPTTRSAPMRRARRSRQLHVRRPRRRSPHFTTDRVHVRRLREGRSPPGRAAAPTAWRADHQDRGSGIRTRHPACNIFLATAVKDAKSTSSRRRRRHLPSRSRCRAPRASAERRSSRPRPRQISHPLRRLPVERRVVRR